MFSLWSLEEEIQTAESSMCYEKLREQSDFRLKKKNEHKWTENALGEDAGLFNILYDLIDTLKMQTEWIKE